MEMQLKIASLSDSTNNSQLDVFLLSSQSACRERKSLLVFFALLFLAYSVPVTQFKLSLST